jgi:NitT/TauT family transport system substrate-binding protein
MKMMKRSLFMVVGLLIITGLISVQAKELQKVSCSEAVRGFFFVPLYVAHGKGFFEKEGLKVEIVSAQGGPMAMQALVSGQVQFCATGHGQVANLFTKGKKTKIINQMQDKCTFSMVGRPEIKGLKNLKGKGIGVSKIGAETHGVGRFLAAKAGLDPGKDITMVEVGGMSTMASALENNRVQAVMAWEPLTSKLIAEKKGILLARLNTKEDSLRHFGLPSYSFSVIEVTEEYLKKNHKTVQKFVNAMVAAEKWIASHSIDELVGVINPYFSGTEKDILKIALENDREAFSKDGLVTKEGHNSALKVFMDAGMIEQNVAFEDIVDNSFSQRALKVSKKQ